MSSLIPRLTPNKKPWYRAEKNTSALIRSVVASPRARNLSGDQIWSLITLTWITKSPNGAHTNHWRKLKVPALKSLFSPNAPDVVDDLSAAVDSMNLPLAVAQSAKKETGMVNFHGTWRKSSRPWCRENRDDLMKIIRAAANLANDQARFEVARRIDKLPPVKSPNNKVETTAGVLLSPLIACLDPRCRFPIVNGRTTPLLRKLRLTQVDLRDRVKRLIEIIGQKDAFKLDVMTDEVIKRDC